MSFANDPSVTTAITAFAGGGAASAVELKSRVNVVSVCATGADSVKLPANCGPGAEVFVRNLGAAACAVFPPTGGAVNGGTVNIAFSVTNAKAGWFHCTSADGLTWTATLSA